MQEYMQKVQIFAEAFIISATFGWDNGFVAVCLLARTITQNVMGAFWRNLGILIIKYSVHLYRIHKVWWSTWVKSETEVRLRNIASYGAVRENFDRLLDDRDQGIRSTEFWCSYVIYVG